MAGLYSSTLSARLLASASTIAPSTVRLSGPEVGATPPVGGTPPGNRRAAVPEVTVVDVVTVVAAFAACGFTCGWGNAGLTLNSIAEHPARPRQTMTASIERMRIMV